MVTEAKRTAGPGKHFFVKYQIRETSCTVAGDKLWQDCDYSTSAGADSGGCTAQVYIDKAEKFSHVIQECKITPGNMTHSQYEKTIENDCLDLLPVVRKAIWAFNNQSHQFSLFDVGEIIKARTQVFSGIHYSLRYKIKKTDCYKDKFHELGPECKPISGKAVAGTIYNITFEIWKTKCSKNDVKKLSEDCMFTDDSDTGECTAQVYVDLADKITNINQECTLIPGKDTVSRTRCSGCPYYKSKECLQLLPTLRYATRYFNKLSGQSSLFHAVEFRNARLKEDTDLGYEFEYEAQETNCNKHMHHDLDPVCKPIPCGRLSHCGVETRVHPSGQIEYFQQTCILSEPLYKPICLGCPVPIPTSSTELEEPLNATVDKFNAESIYDFYYKADKILYATVQVVAGKKYDITFKMRKTSCPKGHIKKLGEDYVATEDSETLICTAQVHVVPWEHTIRPEVKCIEHKTMLVKGPSGFTPFQLATVVETAQNTTEIEHEEGARDGEAPSVPKCPGKPWKPIIHLSTTTEGFSTTPA